MDDARYRLEDLKRRREIVSGLLARTRLRMQALILECDVPEPRPEDLRELAKLTWTVKVLIAVTGQLADEATQLTLELTKKNTEKRRRAVAPVIDPSEIEVPDHMPNEL